MSKIHYKRFKAVLQHNFGLFWKMLKHFQRMSVVIFNNAKFLCFIADYKIRYIKIQTVDTLQTKGNFCFRSITCITVNFAIIEKAFYICK